MDVGLLVLRLVVGLLFVGHGCQKLFGWFDGGGFQASAKFFEWRLGFRHGRASALAAGLTEIFGGAMLAAGLLTPLAGAAILGLMMSAVVSQRGKSLLVGNGGLEYPLVMAGAGVAFAFTGPGALSLDAAFGITYHGVVTGVGAVGLGIVAALTALATKVSGSNSRRKERPGRHDSNAAVPDGFAPGSAALYMGNGTVAGSQDRQDGWGGRSSGSRSGTGARAFRKVRGASSRYSDSGRGSGSKGAKEVRKRGRAGGRTASLRLVPPDG
jgi:putative oxidoreductase